MNRPPRKNKNEIATTVELGLVPFGIVIVINILPIILLPIALLPLFLALIAGLLFVFAYLHCWLAVTWHLTTGQYEIPGAVETQEW